ncbi:tetratricopeptide repeat protein, partial [Patescibacteria group bacterium]|nr:tetratricopeptide repeat protein [Patescibacteria group bacterium]
SILLFLVSSLKTGRLTLPFNKILLSVWLLPIAYFFSSLFSVSPRSSFLGQGLEGDTFGFIVLMALLVTLVVMLMRTKEQVLYTYLALFVSFIVVWVFQGLRLIFGADFLSFDVLTLTTSNILGKWNDLSIFFGLATVLTLVTLASLQLSVLYKRILYAMLVVSLFFLAVVNFKMVWIIVGLFALGFFVHSISIGRFNWKKAVPEGIQEGHDSPPPAEGKEGTPSMSTAALIVLVVSVLFVLGGTTIGSVLSGQFNISQIEARPSFQSTIDVGRETYKENFLFGSGPNTFVKQWVKFKPIEINETLFWNADFIAGYGFIPTSFVTVGLVGIVAWVVFLASFVYGGLKALILAPVNNRFSYYISLSSFLAALYLWIFAATYTPNVVLLTLAFLFTGIFISSLRHYSARFAERTFEFANNPKTGFVSVLGITVLLLTVIVGLYTVGKQYAAATRFQAGIVALNVQGDLDAAEANIQKAAEINVSDRYYRLLADINIGRISFLQTETDLSEDELRSRFQTLLARAIANGQRATDLDSTNYQNWLALGRVYQSIVPLGIEGAYENAKTSYDRALAVNPTGPAIYLTLARLEVAKGDTLAARDFIAQALELKSNYTESIFLLSQIEIAEGNLEEAIASVEATAVLAPNDPVVFFQLGLLHYNQNNNDKAISSLERAVGLNNVYSNARYFLALSYDRVGRKGDAIVQFELIQELNQDNEEVMQILVNLRAGRAPFENIVPPAEPPEEREELPIEE